MPTKKHKLKNKRLFLLDIDGTVCKGKQLIDGTREMLQEIKDCGGRFVFVTNNATKSIKDYRASFRELGIETEEFNFVTASYVTVQYLKKHYENQLIYVVGTDSFIKELKHHQIRVTTDAHNTEIGCVLVSYDNQLTYKKIQDTCELLTKREIDYIATNPDYSCPTEFGYIPDCGAICEMISHAVKKMPYFIGKPEPAIVEFAMQLNEFSREETLIVGDRLYTDILCGKQAGVDTALVLTGEATLQDIEQSECQPDYIFDSIDGLYKEWMMYETKL
ncbi:MAG: HAD-IIA family hydrolase [bacterium]|nr:HAD-IIA family hydrolase [bacterium]